MSAKLCLCSPKSYLLQVPIATVRNGMSFEGRCSLTLYFQFSILRLFIQKGQNNMENNIAKNIPTETVKPTDFDAFFKSLCYCIEMAKAMLIEGVCLVHTNEEPTRNKAGSKVYKVTFFGIGTKTVTVKSIFSQVWHFVLQNAFDSVIVSDLEKWLRDLSKQSLEFEKQYTFPVSLAKFKHLSHLQRGAVLDAIRRTVTDNNFISRNGTFTIEGEKVKIPTALVMDIDTVKGVVNFGITMPKSKVSKGAQIGATAIDEGKKATEKTKLPATHKKD